jgi:hypothetical protein
MYIRNLTYLRRAGLVVSYRSRSEALTKTFLLPPRDMDVPGAREILKQGRQATTDLNQEKK